jgi:hypothetical protein
MLRNHFKYYGLLLAALLAGTGQARAADGDKRGDANGDGAVNMTDVTMVVNKFHGIADPTCPLNADANGDGVINMTDVTIIVNIFHYGTIDADSTIHDWQDGGTVDNLQPTSDEEGGD